MPVTVDFKKIDAAFQHLADSPEGNKALETLNSALNHVTETAGKLNSNEAHYLLTNLIQQRHGGFGPNINTASAGARVKSGFLIKTAVD